MGRSGVQPQRDLGRKSSSLFVCSVRSKHNWMCWCSVQLIVKIGPHICITFLLRREGGREGGGREGEGGGREGGREGGKGGHTYVAYLRGGPWRPFGLIFFIVFICCATRLTW